MRSSIVEPMVWSAIVAAVAIVAWLVVPSRIVLPSPSSPSMVDARECADAARAELASNPELEPVRSAESEAHVTLHVVPPPGVSRLVPLAGTVRYGRAWGSERLDLRLAPLDASADAPADPWIEGVDLPASELPPVADDPNVVRFDAGDLPPGRYLVSARAYPFRQLLDTGADGTDAAEIVIGDPAAIVVRALDDSTGTPVDARRPLLWRPRASGSAGDDALESVAWSEPDHGWRFRAPPGEIELVVDVDATFEPLAAETRLFAPGAQESTLRLRRATALFLTLECDGAAVEWPERCARSVALASIEDPRRSDSPTHSNEDQVAFRLPAPGAWRVVVPPLPGFEPVGAFDVTLARGEARTTVIALQRTP